MFITSWPWLLNKSVYSKNNGLCTLALFAPFDKEQVPIAKAFTYFCSHQKSAQWPLFSVCRMELFERILLSYFNHINMIPRMFKNIVTSKIILIAWLCLYWRNNTSKCLFWNIHINAHIKTSVNKWSILYNHNTENNVFHDEFCYSFSNKAYLLPISVYNLADIDYAIASSGWKIPPYVELCVIFYTMQISISPIRNNHICFPNICYHSYQSIRIQ